MSIQFRQKATCYGQNGIVTTTLSLVTHQELERQFKLLGVQLEGNPEPMSEIIRRGETHLAIPNRFSTEVLRIPLEELLHDYKDQIMEELFLFVQNRFQPDTDGAPLYPSDLVDEYRKLGVRESVIQELLLNEKRARDTRSSS